MGVAGSGKTTVGQALANALGSPFFDGDDYHPQSNVDKIASGIPLKDEDRWPWLNQLNRLVAAKLAEGRSLVLACSALKQSYRQLLQRENPCVRFVYLKGDYDLIYSRMQSRPHPYMRPEMLPSQFEALEEPEDAIVIDISVPVEDNVLEIISNLKNR